MIDRDRRAIVVGGAIILGAIGWRAVPAVWRMGGTAREEAAQVVHLAARSQQIVSRRAGLEVVLRARTDSLIALAPRLLQANSATVGNAALSSLLTMWAQDHKLSMTRLDQLPDSTAGIFRRVGISLQGEGDLAGVSGLLRKIEAGRQLLSVRRLSVTNPNDATSSPQRLHFDLQVVGWLIEW
ncbi:MAG: hypothetical protein HY700_09860 [Gemmatimonadetes bacterium]|nr:hypothetical protein [Gemmatimonadota bacterium]